MCPNMGDSFFFVVKIMYIVLPCDIFALSVRDLTLRSLTLYIYMEHLFLMFLDHTQRRSTVGRAPLDE